MSYDVAIFETNNTNCEELFSTNMTSNIGGMIYKADNFARKVLGIKESIPNKNEKPEKPNDEDFGIRFLGSYSRMERVHDKLPWLELVVAYLNDPINYDELKKLEPPNGWGSLVSCREFMRKIFDAAMQAPGTAYFYVSH